MMETELMVEMTESEQQETVAGGIFECRCGWSSNNPIAWVGHGMIHIGEELGG